MVTPAQAEYAAAKLHAILEAVERGEIEVDSPAMQHLVERVEVALAAYDEWSCSHRDAS